MIANSGCAQAGRWFTGQEARCLLIGVGTIKIVGVDDCKGTVDFVSSRENGG